MFFLLLTELGLCDDKKKLKKKRTKRTLKEGEPGYLKSASESDSALDDSTEEYDTVESDSDDSDTLQNHQENIRSKGLDVSQDDVAKPGLLWLKSCLEDELEDRDEEDEAVPIVPITEECILAMERPAFVAILKLMDLSPPNDQEQYWRIPSTFSAKQLSEKSKLLAQLAEDELDFSTINVTLIVASKPQVAKAKKVKKVKKKKTWMPMRRTVDADVVDRIHHAVAKSQSIKTPNRKGKRVIRQNEDSSSDSEDGLVNEKGDSSHVEPKSRAIVESSSDNASDDETKPSEPKSMKSAARKGDLKAIESDDSKDSSADEVDNPSIQKDEAKESASQQKRIRRRISTSSSSDEGVIDPWPTQRVPSDTEEANLSRTTFNTTQGAASTTTQRTSSPNTTRRSRSSSLSSSSSSFRSRSSLSSRSSSSSRSPSPSRNNLAASSNSNTPKRARSSPSPLKSEKRMKRLLSDSSSNEDGDGHVINGNVKKKSSSLLISSDEEK